MSTPPFRFRPRAGGGDGGANFGGAPQRPPFRAPNPYFFSSSSSIPQYRQNRSFQNLQPTNPLTLDRAEAAVAKAHRDLIAAGESVNVWKLSQNAALSLHADSWGSLGFSFHQVPSLRNLLAIEGKVHAFIQCFVTVRRMTSVHDLDVEICKSEGVERFDELGLGPLLRHPLVQHYFSVPSDAKDVCKITFEDLISRLSVFLYRYRNKEMKVEEFLDYLVEKHSVSKKEDLGVRIQSLGLYIKFIKGCRRAESSAFNYIRESRLPKGETENSPDATNDSPAALNNSIEGSGLLEGEAERSPVDIPSSSKPPQDDDYEDNVVSNKGKVGKPSTSLGPPTIDDMKLLGIKLAKYGDSNGGKKLVGKEDWIETHSPNIYKVMQMDQEKAGKVSLKDEAIGRFVATWKGACEKGSLAEVLAVMLNVYIHSDKRKRKMQRLFLSYPAVGLLNVAVKSIRYGMLDHPFHNNEKESFGELSSPTPCLLDVEPPTEIETNTTDCAHNEEVVKSVSVDDIVKNVAKYFELNCLVTRRGDLQLEKQLVFRDCEIWLKAQFSLEEFESIGYGTFFEFLDEHASFLPYNLHDLSVENSFSSSSLEVSMLHKQLMLMLSQAAKNFRNDSVLSEQGISIILKKQFPTISFQIMVGQPERAFANLTKGLNNFDASSPVLFSVSLSENFNNKKSSLNCENATQVSEFIGEGGPQTSPLGSVSTKDAMECLFRAPILSDLQSWSHWDLLFAPSLGPLMEWLLNAGHINELSCLVTRDGRIIKIEQSATFDEFLEAAIQGSSSKAAAKFLSLVCEHGGSTNVPLPLLNCYTRRAIDVIIQNFDDSGEVNSAGDVLGNASLAEKLLTNEVEYGKISLPAAGNEGSHDVHKDVCRINHAYSAVSVFILDFLGHLPPEFRSFAASIFISGLRSFTRGAADIILCQCEQVNQRIMLHDIGWSLGIVEWIKDYHAFTLDPAESDKTEIAKDFWHARKISHNLTHNGEKRPVNFDTDPKIMDRRQTSFVEISETKSTAEGATAQVEENLGSEPGGDRTEDANLLIKTIRCEEFGLDSDLKNAETILLKKQHARLGRALRCLAQELYSQDSHFLLELVQNADDNSYPENVEATLVFILQDTGIIVLNNELGFSEKNIRALCDVGSSTKKGSTAGYIGQKGLGFKSVFRVTDAPEIHSNGFHVKFDITEGQIGFVLPTIIPPFDVNFLKRELCDFDQAYSSSWNTCIVLPFRPNFRSGVGMSSIINMFSDLHPSLLLFLHRLKCIVFKNMIDNSLCVMKREILDDGIIMVTHQEDKMTWLVVNQDFPASIIRPDVQTTKISLAFTLQESDDGDYKPCLDQQPAFAFLPLRKYGLKFILQGDFILPSSREEIDGDNAWNQWLLSEYPNLFISAEKSFCSLPCFQESPGKAITTYMSFVPLVGEVQGFFSHLPRMILSKLRLSNCLLMDGMNEEWVPPSKVLRGWDEQARSFLSDSLLQQHLGLGYLRRDIILPDSLAKALGIQEYGPKFLVDILSSLCHAHADVRSLGTEWISSWLNALYNSLAAHSSAYLKSVNSGMESKLIDMIRELPFIPLSDGSYSSLAEGPIWLPFDASVFRFEGEDGIKHFSSLFSKLRIVTPHLFPLITNDSCVDENRINNLICILSKIGVQKLAAHDIIIELILPSMSNEICTNTNVQLMIEYLCFIMIHLQSACSNCHTERAEIISKLQTKAIILTNQGFKCPLEESVHFSKDYGNVVDVNRLIDNTELKWIEVDDIYLKHPSTKSLSFGMSKWREFFLELGVTDFVKVIYVANNAADLFMGLRSIPHFGDHNGSTLSAGDWQSHELIQLLSALSTGEHLAQCKYLLEVLNKMWDDYFSAKAKKDNALQFGDQKEPLESSFMKSILNTKWVPCSLDDKVYYPRDVFHDCEAVRSILGSLAPYAVPKVSSKKFLADIGFKVQVTLVDALRTFKSVKFSDTPSASISQMSKLYTFIQEELATWKGNMEELRTSLLIFIPNSRTSSHMDVAPGKFLSPDELCWHDPTGCVDWMMKKKLQCASTSEVKCLSHITVSDIYPSLHDFFVNDCGVPEVPPFGIYLQILLLLSTCASPSEVAHEVFQVFVRWTDDFRSGLALSDDINNLRDYLLKPENMILPTMQDKWVSLHPSHGIVCWSGDEELIKQYTHSDGVCLLDFGELTSLKKEMLQSSVASLMQQIGIPALSEVLSREAIFYGISNNTEIASLVDWILPCAQRYLYKKHPDVYFQLKEAGFESLIQLQIIVVEKLFYKNSLKGRESVNNKRFECSCLLQGNILYTTDTADSHSFFLELSRYFFHGITELHMANFLHMVATMLDLGSTNDQIESFIVHNQKVSELPEGESIWSLSRSVAPNEDDISVPLCGLPMIKRQHYPRVTRNPDVKRSWPPTNWENAPIFQFASNTLSAAPEAVPALSSETVPKNLVETAVLKYNDGKLFMGGNSSTGASNFAESESIEQRAQQNTPDVNEQIIANVEPAQTLPAMNSVPIPERLCWEIQEVNQSLETGRLGEMIAYEYFSEKLGSANVVWVNRESESGLPYDLIVNEANRMYVEVKSTRSINKDWFPISANEWHCAAQKGNSFSIVWVNLSSPAKPKILILKNPLRLCQENLLQLAILLSSKTENSNT